jgi:hypothetical protein
VVLFPIIFIVVVVVRLRTVLVMAAYVSHVVPQAVAVPYANGGVPITMQAAPATNRPLAGGPTAYAGAGIAGYPSTAPVVPGTRAPAVPPNAAIKPSAQGTQPFSGLPTTATGTAAGVQPMAQTPGQGTVFSAIWSGLVAFASSVVGVIMVIVNGVVAVRSP